MDEICLKRFRRVRKGTGEPEVGDVFIARTRYTAAYGLLDLVPGESVCFIRRLSNPKVWLVSSALSGQRGPVENDQLRRFWFDDFQDYPNTSRNFAWPGDKETKRPEPLGRQLMDSAIDCSVAMFRWNVVTLCLGNMPLKMVSIPKCPVLDTEVLCVANWTLCSPLPISRYPSLGASFFVYLSHYFGILLADSTSSLQKLCERCSSL